MKETRFVTTINMFVWADDESGAKQQSQELVEELRKRFDNRANVESIYYLPIGFTPAEPDSE